MALAAGLIVAAHAAPAECGQADHEREDCEALCAWQAALPADVCKDRYDRLVQQRLSNPYDVTDGSVIGAHCREFSREHEAHDECLDLQSRSIARLSGIYLRIVESRASAEMRGRPSSAIQRNEDWLDWCYQDYRPDLGTSSYIQLLRCWDPKEAKSVLRREDPPDHRSHTFSCGHWPKRKRSRSQGIRIRIEPAGPSKR